MNSSKRNLGAIALAFALIHVTAFGAPNGKEKPPAKQTELWQGLSQGMTLAEFQARVPDATRKDAGDRPNAVQMELPPVPVLGYAFRPEANFYNDKLVGVRLFAVTDDTKAAALTNDLRVELGRKYGKEISSRDGPTASSMRMIEANWSLGRDCEVSLMIIWLNEQLVAVNIFYGPRFKPEKSNL